jgi:hypothetical protein
LLTYNIAETVTYPDGNEIGDINACGLQSKRRLAALLGFVQLACLMILFRQFEIGSNTSSSNSPIRRRPLESGGSTAFETVAQRSALPKERRA